MLLPILLASFGIAGPHFPHRHPPAGAHELIVGAVNAAGGIDALRSIRALRVVTQEQLYSIGQEAWPGAPAPLLVEGLQTAVIDRASGAIREDTQRFSVPGALGIPAKGRFITGTSTSDYGTVFLDPERKIPRSSLRLPVSAAKSMFETYRFAFPDRILIEAYDAPPTSLRPLPAHVIGGRAVSGVTVALPSDTLQLWFDDGNHRLVAVSLSIIDVTRGKLSPVETRHTYANWTRMGNVSLPWTVVMTVEGATASVHTTVAGSINPAGVDSLFHLDSLAHLTESAADRPVSRVTTLAPGIFRLEGATHSPLAVQLGDSVILLEAPAGPSFTTSLLDSLHSHLPGAPVRAFVVTHFHSDHIAGVPTAFAAGLSAIAPAEISTFVERLGLTPTQRPAKPRRVTAVRDSMSVGTGPSRFTLYHVPTAHVDALLMAYFPEAKLLYDIDLAAGPPDDRQALYDFIERHHLAVDNLSRIHGPVLSWAAFLKTVPDTSSSGK